MGPVLRFDPSLAITIKTGTAALYLLAINSCGFSFAGEMRDG